MKYSVIIRTYNPKIEWLERAINSANGLFDEMIIVDDGCRISISGFIEEKMKDRFAILGTNGDAVTFEDSRKKLLKVVSHRYNLGVCEARNTGVKNATGDIIAWLDDDDYFDNAGVISLKQFVEKNPDGDVFHFPLMMFGNIVDEGKVYGLNANPTKLVEHSEIPGVSWHTRKLWEELNGYQYHSGEDWEFLLRAFLAKKKFIYFNKIPYNVNRRNGSTSMAYVGSVYDRMKKDILEKNGL
jgi:glycosyltransferase involved in cell wall biosynthesis